MSNVNRQTCVPIHDSPAGWMKKNDQVAINHQVEQHCTRIVYDKALSGVSNIYFIFLTKIDMFKMFKYFLSFSSSIEIVYSTSINYEKN